MALLVQLGFVTLLPCYPVVGSSDLNFSFEPYQTFGHGRLFQVNPVYFLCLVVLLLLQV